MKLYMIVSGLVLDWLVIVVVVDVINLGSELILGICYGVGCVWFSCNDVFCVFVYVCIWLNWW